MKDREVLRSELILQLYNSYHEGEAELPDSEKRKNYIFDEGTGTLYCKETDKQYETSQIDEAIAYFVDVAAIIEAELATSADPYKATKKAEYCKIAAEAILYMKKQMEKDLK